MISLSFYGDVPVKGLTLPQIKVAVINQLRKYLSDEVLGLGELPGHGLLFSGPGSALRFLNFPRNEKPLDLNEAPKPIKKTSRAINGNPSRGVPARSLRLAEAAPGLPRVPVRSAGCSTAAARNRRSPDAGGRHRANAPAQTEHSPPGHRGRITITIDVAGQAHPGPGQAQVPPMPGGDLPGVPPEESYRVVRPEDSQMVFVDVTAYNSMQYYVLGDVGTPGRLPWTASETVLDAIQYGGGFVSTADPKQVSLVRPERGGKPARIYKVALAAAAAKRARWATKLSDLSRGPAGRRAE